jgi:hypothetical protein
VVLTATIVESKRPQDYVVLGDFLSYDPQLRQIFEADARECNA